MISPRIEATSALAADRPRLQAGVSTAFPLATEAASGILRQGGNAVDAAVGAAWALSVCEPSASGLGGQTTLLLHDRAGITRVIDGHSRAPRGVSPLTVSAAQQQRGHRSCTIPSTPATLQYAHRKYGRLPWRWVVAPAIRIAEQGFPLTFLQCKQTRWVAASLREDAASSALFLREGQPPAEGEVLRQPRLAQTLWSIAQSGAEEFYRGRLARDIGDDMRVHGGLLDEADLAQLEGPVERAPLSIRFRGLEVVTVPPPGGGLQLLLALQVLEQLVPADAPLEDWYAAVALATYGVFRDRESFSRADALPQALLDGDQASRIAGQLRDGALFPGPAAEEPGDTTHLTVADAEGNIVGLTQSIQSVFGAKVANGKLGFLYNNYLRTCPRGEHPSRLASGCLARSNASPALVLRPGRQGASPMLALGSAGSRRIVSSLLQVIGQVVDRGLSIGAAVDAPRVHALLSGKAWLERRLSSPPLVERLQQRFCSVLEKVPYSFAMGAVHALQFDGGRTQAAADPRRDGRGAVLAGGAP